MGITPRHISPTSGIIKIAAGVGGNVCNFGGSVASGPARRTAYDALPLISTDDADRALSAVVISDDDALGELLEFGERCEDSERLAHHLRLGGYEAMAPDPALSYVDADGIERLRYPAWRHINLLSETSRHERRERGTAYAAFMAHEGTIDLFTIAAGEWVTVSTLATSLDAINQRLENADVAARRKGIAPELAKIELAGARYKDGEALVYLHAHLAYRTNDTEAWTAFRNYLYSRFARVGVTGDTDDADDLAHYLAKPPISTLDLLTLNPDDAAAVARALEHRTMWRPKGSFLKFVGRLRRDHRRAVQIDGTWQSVSRRHRGQSLLPPPPPNADRVIGVSPPTRLPGMTTSQRYLLVRGYSGNPERIAYAQTALSIIKGRDSDAPTSRPSDRSKPHLRAVQWSSDAVDSIPY